MAKRRKATVPKAPLIEYDGLKDEKDDLSSDEKKILKRIADELKREAGGSTQQGKPEDS